MRSTLLLIVAFAWGAAEQLPKRTPDIHYTPTRHNIAEAMLTLAGVTKQDIVYDLGSGDGRLPILAAQLHGARGVGIEIDPKLVAVSRINAKDAGVSDRVTFIEGDLFTADISPATVVTLYLSTSVLRQLEPKLRSELRPGTRIVSHQFWIPGWPIDRTTRVDASELFLLTIPSPLAGRRPCHAATNRADAVILHRAAPGVRAGRCDLDRQHLGVETY